MIRLQLLYNTGVVRCIANIGKTLAFVCQVLDLFIRIIRAFWDVWREVSAGKQLKLKFDYYFNRYPYI